MMATSVEAKLESYTGQHNEGHILQLHIGRHVAIMKYTLKSTCLVQIHIHSHT